MSEQLGKKVYQQRFRSTEQVTASLNEFLKTPQRGFIFFAKQEFIPDGVKKQAGENKEMLDLRIAKRLTDIRNHSLRLGEIGLQISQPVGAIEDENGVELDFSAFAPGAYWKIMEKFYEDKYRTTPSPEVLHTLAQRALYVNLPHDNLKISAGFKVASYNLKHILANPKENYKMQLTKLRGISDPDRQTRAPKDNRSAV